MITESPLPIDDLPRSPLSGSRSNGRPEADSLCDLIDRLCASSAGAEVADASALERFSVERPGLVGSYDATIRCLAGLASHPAAKALLLKVVAQLGGREGAFSTRAP